MALSPIDRLVFIMIAGSQADPLMKQLTGENFRFTVINSTGGLLQESMTCLMIGFSHERMPALIEIIRKNCRSYKKFIPAQGVMPMEQAPLPMVEARLGGATIYMMNVSRFEQV